MGDGNEYCPRSLRLAPDDPIMRFELIVGDLEEALDRTFGPPPMKSADEIKFLEDLAGTLKHNSAELLVLVRQVEDAIDRVRESGKHAL